MSDTEKLNKAIELLESVIMDFEKLEPFIGGAAKATADLYRKEMEPLICSRN